MRFAGAVDECVGASMSLDVVPMRLDVAPMRLDDGPMSLDVAPMRFDVGPMSLDGTRESLVDARESLVDVRESLVGLPSCRVGSSLSFHWQGQHAKTMPAGVNPSPRQVEGTGGPACGPTAPQLTPNSLGRHESVQVHALAQPPVEEQPGPPVATPGHWVGSLLKHNEREPLLAVQETKARAVLQPS